MDAPRLYRRPSVLSGLPRGVVLRLTLLALAALVAWPVQYVTTVAVMDGFPSRNRTYQRGSSIRFVTCTVPRSLAPGEILRPQPTRLTMPLPTAGDGLSVSIDSLRPR